MYRKTLILPKLLQVSAGALSEEMFHCRRASAFQENDEGCSSSVVIGLSEDRSSQAIGSIFGVGGFI